MVGAPGASERGGHVVAALPLPVGDMDGDAGPAHLGAVRIEPGAAAWKKRSLPVSTCTAPEFYFTSGYPAQLDELLLLIRRAPYQQRFPR
jgi:hypothetical protein